MKKFFVLLSAAVFVALNATPAQSKIPATAPAVLMLNTEHLLNWPLFKQFADETVKTSLAKYQLTVQDIQGSIAVGVTFAKNQPKENLRVDAVITLKQPVAAKLFALAEKELAKNKGIVKSKEKGKPCLADETVKIVLAGKNELTLQLRLGTQLKFVRLTAAKNLFNRIKAENASLVAVFDNSKLINNFAKEIPEQAKPLMDGKTFSWLKVDFLPDGALKFQQRDTFKTAADCKKSLEAFNAQLATVKENPAVSAIAEKLKVKTSKNTLTVSGELTAMDLQMAAGSIMMMLMSQQQNMNTPAAP